MCFSAILGTTDQAVCKYETIGAHQQAVKQHTLPVLLHRCLLKHVAAAAAAAPPSCTAIQGAVRKVAKLPDSGGACDLLEMA